MTAGLLDLWLGRRYAMTTMATARKINLPLDEDLIRRARDVTPAKRPRATSK